MVLLSLDGARPGEEELDGGQVGLFDPGQSPEVSPPDTLALQSTTPFQQAQACQARQAAWLVPGFAAAELLSSFFSACLARHAVFHLKTDRHG